MEQENPPFTDANNSPADNMRVLAWLFKHGHGPHGSWATFYAFATANKVMPPPLLYCFCEALEKQGLIEYKNKPPENVDMMAYVMRLMKQEEVLQMMATQKAWDQRASLIRAANDENALKGYRPALTRAWIGIGVALLGVLGSLLFQGFARLDANSTKTRIEVLEEARERDSTAIHLCQQRIDSLSARIAKVDSINASMRNDTTIRKSQKPL